MCVRGSADVLPEDSSPQAAHPLHISSYQGEEPLAPVCASVNPRTACFNSFLKLLTRCPYSPALYLVLGGPTVFYLLIVISPLDSPRMDPVVSIRFLTLPYYLQSCNGPEGGVGSRKDSYVSPDVSPAQSWECWTQE